MSIIYRDVVQYDYELDELDPRVILVKREGQDAYWRMWGTFSTPRQARRVLGLLRQGTQTEQGEVRP